MTWREDYAKEAAQEGRQAFRDGVEANPHIMGSFEYAAWNRGHDAAQEQEHQIALLHALHPPVRRPTQIDQVLEGAA